MIWRYLRSNQSRLLSPLIETLSHEGACWRELSELPIGRTYRTYLLDVPIGRTYRTYLLEAPITESSIIKTYRDMW